MDNDRLSQIETAWSIVRRAHSDSSPSARDAQEQLLKQYGAAIHRYLQAALRDSAAAVDVYQDFAVRFVRGHFHNASQDKGRFRSFLKTSLFRMVADHRRAEQKKAGRQLPADHVDETDSSDQREREFAQVWRDEMLKRAWDALAALEAESGRPWFAVMRLRVDNPTVQSPDLALLLSEELGRRVTTGNVRVLLHRAREHFSRLLIDCISDSLNTSDVEEIEEELAELELLEYCQDALAERK